MKRTNASTRIIGAATNHFARFGYDGSALSGIAELVGIKKASLYAHFTNKDALFMEAFKDAVAAERALAEQCFNLESDEDLPGFKYCFDLVQRFGESEHLQFFLRTSYSSPKHLVGVH